ncbi:MAG: hypothetical protein HZB91_14260 [Elusimicrobia bacterium]|nr:hypothetical protein [Elusimicrobiota bacterium]
MHSPEHEELCLLFEAGELDFGRKADFESTLAGCGECRAFLESLKACHRLCEGARLIPGPELDSRVLAGTPAAKAAPGLLRTRTVVGLSASLVLAAVLAVFLGGPGNQPQDLAWTNGLEDQVAAAGEELEDISKSLGGAADSGDIDDELDALESAAGQMEEQG